VCVCLCNTVGTHTFMGTSCEPQCGRHEYKVISEGQNLVLWSGLGTVSRDGGPSHLGGPPGSGSTGWSWWFHWTGSGTPSAETRLGHSLSWEDVAMKISRQEVFP